MPWKKIPESIRRLRETLDDVRGLEIEKFKPLGVLLDKIHDKISEFEGQNIIMDTFVATKWCAEHQLVQQAFTLLQENMLTAVCLANGLDPHDKEKRNMVSSCINIVSKKIDQSQWHVGSKEPTESQRKEMEGIVSFLEQYVEHIKKLDLINQRRNNINHAEMAHKEDIHYDQLSKELTDLIDNLAPFFDEMNVLARQKL
ncbi:TM1812 family CRISPR-associated protein [Aeribacillus sp. FSL K6-1305]|uniref:TM1812 family CRISPR-associated protein n=1 Tax=Aeribacillus sp. FSL K6-1305 TaxID=2954569 RepID=UPI0030FDDEC5